MNRGGRNLLILGLGSVAIAILTTVVSLVVYHRSGDVYLDRSRPGFLPDETEISEEGEEAGNYKFSDSGEINEETLKEYLEKFDEATSRAAEVKEPFSAAALSDETLGIPTEKSGGAGKKK